MPLASGDQKMFLSDGYHKDKAWEYIKYRENPALSKWCGGAEERGKKNPQSFETHSTQRGTRPNFLMKKFFSGKINRPSKIGRHIIKLLE